MFHVEQFPIWDSPPHCFTWNITFPRMNFLPSPSSVPQCLLPFFPYTPPGLSSCLLEHLLLLFVLTPMTANAPAAAAARESRRPSLFASGAAIVAYFAFARIALYCIAGPHYGYFRDELYYLACGEHPAWGYVDQPPLIAWIAWLLQHTIGTSLWALRLLPALAGAATVVLSGLLARDLGGRRWAIFLASLAALMAPISFWTR